MSHKNAKMLRLAKRGGESTEATVKIPAKKVRRLSNFVAHRLRQFEIREQLKPKPIKLRQRKPKKPIAPTWPRTENQKAQSRPLIVIKPVRARYRVDGAMSIPTYMVKELGAQPKHMLDQL